MTVTPSTATIAVSSSITLSASGGSETTYSWSAASGSVAPGVGASTTYTAPAAAGEDAVTVTDGSTGQIATSTITIE